MTDPARAEGVQIRDALRDRWWLLLAMPGVTVVLALLFVFLVTPTFESTATLRFLEEESPLGGPAAGAIGGGGGAGGLGLLASLTGRSVPIQSEMVEMQSRALARELDDALGLRMALDEPARTLRSELFTTVSIGPAATEGEYLLERTDAGLRVTGDVLVERDPFRPFMNERREERELGVVQPGEPLPIDGAVIVPASGAEEVDEVRFEILSVPDALDRIQERVVVSRPERDADVVQITVEWTDPELAARIAEELSRRFIRRREALQSARSGRMAGFLGEQIDSLMGELQGAEESLRSFREAEGVVEPEAQASAAVEQLAEIQARRDLLAADRNALAALLDEIGSAPAGDGGDAPSPWRRLVFFPTLLQSPATGDLLNLLGELENDRAALYDRRTPDAEEVRVLTARISELEGQLRTMAETFLQGLSNQVAALDGTLAQFTSELARVPSVELEYLRRRRQVELLNELFLFMQLRQKEAEVSAAGDPGGVRILDEPTVPIEPVSPQPALTLGLALVVGLILGVAGAVVLAQAAERREPPEALPPATPRDASPA